MNRFKKSTQKFHTEEGVTLVELLAAIAILSIVVMSFLAFFVQAGNTNNRTDKVNEATFLAQEEMEKVTKYSVENQYDPSKKLVDLKTGLRFDDKNERITSPEGTGFIITTQLSEPEDESELYTVVVTVTEEGGRGNALAKMETRLLFTDQPTNTEP